MKIHGIVVAKSRKNNGYCVVVYDLLNMKFRRLISRNKSRQDFELMDYECTYKNGKTIKLKDEVNLYIYDYKPNDPIQPENYYLDTRYGFEYISKWNVNEIRKEISNVIDKHDDVFYNSHNKVTLKSYFDYSFIICLVKKLKFYKVVVKKTEENFSYETCKCSFEYKGKYYDNISVTISSDRSKDINKYADKEYSDALVGFSIGHQFNGFHYKFLCSVFGTRKDEKNG